MKLQTCGIRMAETMAGRPTWHVISIKSPGGTQAVISYRWGQTTYITLADDRSPDPRAVARIAAAVLRARADGAEGLLVHCEMGVSRSVGIAKAVAARFGLSYDSASFGNRHLQAAVQTALTPGAANG